jgi:hypothetical protein
VHVGETVTRACQPLGQEVHELRARFAARFFRPGRRVRALSAARRPSAARARRRRPQGSPFARAGGHPGDEPRPKLRLTDLMPERKRRPDGQPRQSVPPSASPRARAARWCGWDAERTQRPWDSPPRHHSGRRTSRPSRTREGERDASTGVHHRPDEQRSMEAHDFTDAPAAPPEPLRRSFAGRASLNHRRHRRDALRPGRTRAVVERSAQPSPDPARLHAAE